MITLNNKELEAKVLSTILFSPHELNAILHDFRPDSFYFEPHKTIAKQILSRRIKGEQFDAMVIGNDLNVKGEFISQEQSDWVQFIMLMDQYAGGGANLPTWNLEINHLAQKRQFRELSLGLSDLDYSEPIETLISETGAKMAKITSLSPKRTEVSVRDSLPKVMDIINGKVSAGLPTINTKQNSIFQQKPGDLIITAARPGMGKTAEMLQEAVQKARMGLSVRIVSSEMTSVELTKRLVVQMAKVNNQHVKRSQVDENEMDRINKAVAELENLDISIDESTNFDQIRMNCLSAYNVKKFDWLAVDYLQRLSGGSGDNPNHRIGSIAKGFKNLAKELQIPVWLLSQLNRGVETRGGMKIPTLADLRESGEIEQEADVIRFRYRAQYYGFETCSDGSTPSHGMAEAFIAKNRDGDTGTFMDKWIGNQMRFEEDLEGNWDKMPQINHEIGDAPF